VPADRMHWTGKVGTSLLGGTPTEKG